MTDVDNHPILERDHLHLRAAVMRGAAANGNSARASAIRLTYREIVAGSLGGLFPYHWTRLGDVVRALAVVHNMNLKMPPQL
ncbi:hypothetical protein PO002_43745 [Cupriavidus necator]|uniref:hypothetical protein n=1 Tax=Cupriavidus necator TaxID=106590 RepID=UPI0039C1954C